jgi:hypothetical protein
MISPASCGASDSATRTHPAKEPSGFDHHQEAEPPRQQLQATGPNLRPRSVAASSRGT